MSRVCRKISQYFIQLSGLTLLETTRNIRMRDFLEYLKEEDDYLEYLKKKDYSKCLNEDLSIVSYSIIPLRNCKMERKIKFLRLLILK